MYGYYIQNRPTIPRYRRSFPFLPYPSPQSTLHRVGKIGEEKGRTFLLGDRGQRLVVRLQGPVLELVQFEHFGTGRRPLYGIPTVVAGSRRQPERSGDALGVISGRDEIVDKGGVSVDDVVDTGPGVFFQQGDGFFARDVGRAHEDVFLFVVLGRVGRDEQVTCHYPDFVRVDESDRFVPIDDQTECLLLSRLAVGLEPGFERLADERDEPVRLEGRPVHRPELGSLEQGLDRPMSPGVPDGSVRTDVGVRGRDTTDVLDALCFQGGGQEQGFVDKLTDTVVGSDEETLDLVFLEPGGIDHGPVLLDDLKTTTVLGSQRLGRGSLSVPSERDDGVVRERGVGRELENGVDDTATGVPGRTDDENRRGHCCSNEANGCVCKWLWEL
jgi:hypothetical protein